MKYFKTQKSVRGEILSKIGFILFLDCFIVAGIYFAGPPTTEKTITFSIIGLALTLILGYFLLRNHYKNKKIFIRIADQKLYIGGENLETSIDLNSISKIVKGIKKDEVLFLRLKSPNVGWWTLEGYESLENLSKSIIENSPNASLRIKKKGLVSLSKY